MSSDFLSNIRQITKQRVTHEKHEIQQAFATFMQKKKAHDFAQAFVNDQVNIIAEIKFSSPLVGGFGKTIDPVDIASGYLRNNAVAISILTEPYYFKGSVQYLKQVRTAFPEARLLMKDFILVDTQLMQAVMAGADAILLIVSFLTENELHSLYKKAIELGLTPLVEVHTVDEFLLAKNMGAHLIGVNNRDLKTLKIDFSISEKIAKYKDDKIILISESGIRLAEDILDLQQYGYQGFLIGTSFMESENPGLALKNLMRMTNNEN